MNRPFAVSAAASILLLVGCRDLPEAPLPTAVDEQVLHSNSAEQESTASGERSTVCSAFGRQLGQARLELDENPGDPLLQEKVSRLHTVVTDACN
jgi:hypothetical protein